MVSAGGRGGDGNRNRPLLGCADQSDVYNDCGACIHRGRTERGNRPGCDARHGNGPDGEHRFCRRRIRISGGQRRPVCGASE